MFALALRMVCSASKRFNFRPDNNWGKVVVLTYSNRPDVPVHCNNFAVSFGNVDI